MGRKKNKKYVAGNWLRGFYEGKFSSIEQAWSYLSNRFLLSYPAQGGRNIYMYVEKENEFGIKDLILCKDAQLTELNDLPEKKVLLRCKHSHYRLL